MRNKNLFQNWCEKNNLLLENNNEVFFINEKHNFKPRYIVNKKYYVDIIREIEETDEHIRICDEFSRSYGNLIVLFKEILPELHQLSKSDIEENFDILF